MLKNRLTCLGLSFGLSLIFIVSVNAQTKAKMLHRLFDSLANAHQYNGSVLVADSGKVIFKGAYGYADFEHRVPVSLQTGFEIASVSKQFTAMAIMQLHNKGKLNYNDPITKFLPGLPYKEVTINDLIHHCSGIADFLGWTKEQLPLQGAVCTNEDVEKALPRLAPVILFEPGTAYAYSNTNYLLLANIVSKISGLSFPDYLLKNIFTPAHMDNTFIPRYDYSHFKSGDYAHNYQWDPVTSSYKPFSQIALRDYYHWMSGTYGHAGIQTTVTDLYNWIQAIRKNTLVPASVFSEAMRPFLNKNGKDTIGYEHMAYTFGWLYMPNKDSSETFIWHNGGIGGYRSQIVYYPKLNRTIIMLQNTDRTVSEMALMPSILQILHGNSDFDWPYITVLPRAIKVDGGYLEQLTGLYVKPDQPDIKMLITSKNGRLYAKYMNQVPCEVYAESKDRFFYTDVKAQLQFSRQNGKYTTVTLLQNGLQIPMTRN